MKRTDIKELVNLLIDMQETCAPIELSIGGVRENIVKNEYIVIKSAPPVVAQKLVNEGYLLTVTGQGVEVNKI